MAKETDENTKKYWQEMLADMQEKIKGNKMIPLENSDIQALKTKTDIAIGTLNGYFGLDKSKMPATYPNADTRNLLAQYLGFADWNDYVQSKTLQTVETETVQPKIIWTMDNLDLFKKQLKELLQDGKYSRLFEIVDKMIEEGVLVGNARSEYAKFKKQFKKGVNKQDEDYDERITVWINDLKK